MFARSLQNRISNRGENLALEAGCIEKQFSPIYRQGNQNGIGQVAGFWSWTLL